MRTYADLLKSLESTPHAPAQSFVGSGAVERRTALQVLEAARSRAAALAHLGLARGDRVGLMVSNAADFLPLIHACLMSGLVAVPLYPPPLFGSIETHVSATQRILETAQTQVLVLDDVLASKMKALRVARLVALTELQDDALWVEQTSPDPAELALLQFTSGSTGQPKGVSITHGALMANAHAIMVDGLDAGPEDHGVSWLPLYHDMGLIGFGLAPLLTRTSVTFIPTSRFVRNPGIWLQTIQETQATITFAPNFAYALTAERVKAKQFDLTSIRMWGCGAEPISAQTLQKFEERFLSSGVKPGSVAPCYGLAEATLAVCFTPPGVPRSVHEVKRQDLELRGRALDSNGEPARPIVGCGIPLPGYEISIVDASGRELQDGHIGEILVRGPSLGAGYYNNPEQTTAVFQKQGLLTGDRGYLHQGSLYVTGRLKDTIIVNGRNYDPHVLEAVAESMDGVRLAAAVNFDDGDGEKLALLVERSGPVSEDLQEQLRRELAKAVGVHVQKVVCLRPGALPRTTSGKLRRHAACELLVAD